MAKCDVCMQEAHDGLSCAECVDIEGHIRIATDDLRRQRDELVAALATAQATLHSEFCGRRCCWACKDSSDALARAKDGAR